MKAATIAITRRCGPLLIVAMIAPGVAMGGCGRADNTSGMSVPARAADRPGRHAGPHAADGREPVAAVATTTNNSREAGDR
ncbi:hypothetical protein [Paraburkholderia caballeronis]|uniref:hypothetical protein n=1 Tax=Paraburkholderia caballeronis TaxID=416943 RepID=UPI0010653B2C|nr:hypothetical protein [Paraburkholderia caballeronis]TDV21070.1 hypothetical protein C7408_101589 [Paraburkholderia caballeronis]TDV21499.1 hypothetical protein C7406_102399 [Paraburkholderia caballeronis]TDV33538.1 hypothetical protein C7404_101685 [Paraburkholderia caballeronis]